MAKLTTLVFLALFSLLALRHITAHRATVITTVVEELDKESYSNPREQCQQQIWRQMNLRNCQSYMSQQSSNYYDDDVVENPQRESSLLQCCQELGSVSEGCRCEALQYAFRVQRQEGRFRGTLKRAQELPSTCNLRPQRCSIQL